MTTALLAANDDSYSVKRNRTLPRPGTVFHVPNYPHKLRIFLTNASSYWQVRCFFDGKTITRSLRTTRRREAQRLAQHFYNQQLLKSMRFETCTEKPNCEQEQFRTVAARAFNIEEARVQRGEYSKGSLKILGNRLNNYVLPFFADKAVSSIDFDTLNEFVAHISRTRASPTTISQYLVVVRKVLNYAVMKNMIAKLPVFPKVKIKESPRSSFSVREYAVLLRTAKQCRHAVIPIKTTPASKHGSGRVDRYAYMPFEMPWLIGFMVNTFIRPSDLRNLKHKHVEVVRGTRTYLRLNLPESKNHDKPIVSMPQAVRVYQHLLQEAQRRAVADAEDYLFMPETLDRSKAMEHMRYAFKHVVRTAGLQYAAKDGKERTLYCLRHTAITFRLLYGQGIDLLTLARNARTSVKMIDKFYASTLQPEMNVGILHSRRRV